MLDPLTALSVAGNVVQFIDFGLKATSKAREIHKSHNGALKENLDLETLIEDIALVTAKLELSAAATSISTSLDTICGQCTIAANELLSALKGLKVEGYKSKLKSARKGLKAVWGKKRVEELKTRLEAWRDEIQLHILVDLKCQIDDTNTKYLEHFASLDESAKALLEGSSQNAESIENAIRTESIKLDERHHQSTAVVISKQEETRVELTNTLESMDANIRAEHEATRREIEQLKAALAQIETDMIRRDEELKELLYALSKAHGDRERKKIQEKSNAVTVALCALVTMYESLQKIIITLQGHTKIILSNGLNRLWELKQSNFSRQSSLTQRTMYQSVYNKPSTLIFVYPAQAERANYIKHCCENYSMLSGRHVSRSLETRSWIGRVSIDYRLFSAMGTEQQYAKSPNLGALAALLDCQDKCWTIPQGHSESQIVRDQGECTCFRRVGLDGSATSTANFCFGFALVESCIGLSTILATCMGSLDLAFVALMCTFDPEWQDILLDRTSERNRTSLLKYKYELDDVRKDVKSWIWAGTIAGLAQIAEKIVNDRRQKWESTASGIAPQAFIEFLRWLLFDYEKKEFSFPILDGAPAGSTELYATVEGLLDFGFDLILGIELVPSFGTLLGRVIRKHSAPGEDITYPAPLPSPQDTLRGIRSRIGRIVSQPGPLPRNANVLHTAGGSINSMNAEFVPRNVEMKILVNDELHELPVVEPVGSELHILKGGTMDNMEEWPMALSNLSTRHELASIPNGEIFEL